MIKRQFKPGSNMRTVLCMLREGRGRILTETVVCGVVYIACNSSALRAFVVVYVGGGRKYVSNL